MKNPPVRPAVCALAKWARVWLAVLLIGCGQGPREDIPSEEFEAAITRYLTEKSFEMKPSSMRTIIVSGDEARGTWKLRHADSDLGLAVTWEFRFERKDDAWSVVNHAQK